MSVCNKCHKRVVQLLNHVDDEQESGGNGNDYMDDGATTTVDEDEDLAANDEDVDEAFEPTRDTAGI